MTDDFSNYPKSLAEQRAEREKDGRLWTPRDALLALLRDIDKGVINPTDVCVAYKWKDHDNAANVSFICAGPCGRWEMVGMLEQAKTIMLTGEGSI